jgi:hypothetical protein
LDRVVCARCHGSTMKRCVFTLLSLAVFLSAVLDCDVTREGIVVEITADQIQARLDKAFPITETYLMVFELTLADPEVILTEGSDRVGFGLTARTNVRVNGNDVVGRALLTAGLKYDAPKGVLYLADTRVEGLKMPVLPEEYEDNVLAAANLAVRKYLKEYEVYRLDQTDFKQRLAKMALKDVVVREGVVKMVFGFGDR